MLLCALSPVLKLSYSGRMTEAIEENWTIKCTWRIEGRETLTVEYHHRLGTEISTIDIGVKLYDESQKAAALTHRRIVSVDICRVGAQDWSSIGFDPAD